jgi:hypothetical protein
MINEVLAVLRDRLEGVLQAIYPQGERWVLLGNAGAQDGEPKGGSNKMMMSVVSLQIDASTGAFVPPQPTGSDWYHSGYPQLHLDVVFMVAANFTDANYEAGLAMLSRVIAFFQESPVLTHESAPRLPPGLDKVAIEMVNLDFAQLSHLLSAAGVKYVPLVLYRLRRLPFAGPSLAAAAPVVRAAGAGAPLDGREG